MIANDWRSSVPPIAIARVEEAGDGESAAGKCDHDAVEFTVRRSIEELRVELVVEQVVPPAAATLTVVVDLENNVPAELFELGLETIRPRVRPREQVEEAELPAIR